MALLGKRHLNKTDRERVRDERRDKTYAYCTQCKYVLCTCDEGKSIMNSKEQREFYTREY